ncbi:ketopantoate reductase family protein [Acidovorax sp.]|uniref:ketopantoate reductase family protein n=1 Tax=Acidovorax sp. TaxID=1872122 RepID=UPI003BAF6AED
MAPLPGRTGAAGQGAAATSARRASDREGSMKIAVMGAGAVGCYYGGMLARAGHEVTLIARAHHAEAMNAQGLLLETQAFTQRMRVAAGTNASAVRGAQWVLVCVKSTDTESAGRALAPHLAEGTVVLSLQNGVDNAERLQAVIGRLVILAVVYVATEMAGPGHVRHHGRGELVIAPSPASADIATTLGAAGVPVQVSDDVAVALWAKLVLNCAYNALSAITRLTYGEIMDSPLDVPRVMQDIVHECQRVAQASGIALPADTLDAVLRLAATMPAQMSSTAQDLARGKRSEIDHLNGFIVRRGEALGIATPVNRLLHTLVRLLEKNLPAAQGGAA